MATARDTFMLRYVHIRMAGKLKLDRLNSAIPPIAESSACLLPLYCLPCTAHPVSCDACPSTALMP